MTPLSERRSFLKSAAAGALAPLASATLSPARESGTTRVVVWDERQPRQKEAYPNFLGNRIAETLSKLQGFSVKSVALDDPDQGLSDAVLDACDVLIWWGHVRQAEVTPETGRKIVKRILDGKLSLLAIHSAHWSTPFVEAMNERARRDVYAKHGDKIELVEVPPAKRYVVPKLTDRVTPWSHVRKFPDGATKVELHLPICCFPAYRGDGKPSTVRVAKPDHPIAAGIPARFEIARTEMYDEPFHVPEPDEVVLEECWAPGEWFRSGMVWNLGKGRVFYFRPGHETYPVFFEDAPSRIVANAARWLASK